MAPLNANLSGKKVADMSGEELAQVIAAGVAAGVEKMNGAVLEAQAKLRDTIAKALKGTK